MIRNLIIIITLVIILSYIANSQSLYTRASFGIASYTLSDWTNFFGDITDGGYSKNNPNMYYMVSFGYQLNERHSIAVEVEYLQAKPYLMDVPAIDWEFTGIPINLSYEYNFIKLRNDITPYIGLGLSYVISEANATVYGHPDLTVPKRTGNGYGIHTSIGFLTDISSSLFLNTQFKYRYSDGMAFTDNEGDIKVEFTGFYFNFGVGFRFN